MPTLNIADSWANADLGLPAAKTFIREHDVLLIGALIAYSALFTLVILVRWALRRRLIRNIAERLREVERLTVALKNSEDRRLMLDTKRVSRGSD